jgi:hypothetical protein
LKRIGKFKIELFDINHHSEKLVKALKEGDFSKEYVSNINFFDIKPFHYQEEILEKLEVEKTYIIDIEIY